MIEVVDGGAKGRHSSQRQTTLSRAKEDQGDTSCNPHTNKVSLTSAPPGPAASTKRAAAASAAWRRHRMKSPLSTWEWGVRASMTGGPQQLCESHSFPVVRFGLASCSENLYKLAISLGFWRGAYSANSMRSCQTRRRFLFWAESRRQAGGRAESFCRDV